MQEPGASDNASGCGTLLAAALAMQDGIRRGTLPAPARTITLLWVDEISGSRQWIKDHADQLKDVVAMLSLDMTGEDTTKTGGTFLIEKEPDPSAVWERPSDPHSEWGAGKVDPAIVRGSFLNDLHLAVALRRARDTQLGGANQSVRRRQRSHGVHRPPGCRRCSTGTSPTATTTPISTPSTRSARPRCSMSRSWSGRRRCSWRRRTTPTSAPMTTLMETARDARLATEQKNNATPEILAGVAQVVRRGDCERSADCRIEIADFRSAVYDLKPDIAAACAAGPYISVTYCLTMRRVEKRGTFDRIASRTMEIQRRGSPRPPRSRS